MNGTTTIPPREAEAPRQERVLGSYETGRAGPLVLVLGAVHGNEPSGIIAAQRVLAKLQERGLELRGRFVALVGNLEALRQERRFVHTDLNRMWTPEGVARLRAQDSGFDTVEEAQQRELLAVIDGEIERAQGEVVFFDLHSSSAPGAPFTAINDTLQNRRFAVALPIPSLVGLEESVRGPVLEYVGERGHVAVAMEGGQHTDARTIDRHEAAIWITLVTAGALRRADVPSYDAHYAHLRSSARGLPGILEIVYRQALAPGDAFKMEPGFTNFSEVKHDRLLARDQRGDVRAPRDGFLMLPLYQGQGEDGFFLGVEIRRFWLRLSAVLRRLRLDRFMHWLPGVRRDDEDPTILRCDPRVARWFAKELFHLFGYRKLASKNGDLGFRRRPDRF